MTHSLEECMGLRRFSYLEDGLVNMVIAMDYRIRPHLLDKT